MAETLREEVSVTILTAMGKLTASFGVAAYPDSVHRGQELVYGAQPAMYWAKAKGGNRVGYWGEMLGTGPWKRPGATADPVAALVAALERKLRAGSGQLARSAWYAAKVAAEMGVGAQEQDLIEKAALLHDVGKLAVPDTTLQKPGALSQREKDAVKAHPSVGREIVSRIPELAGAATVIAHHHEHFDGSGYPRGLRGDAIPRGARIFAVADAFDAITSDRPYRDARSHIVAIEEIAAGSGTQFDPEVVEALLRVLGHERAVAPAPLAAAAP